MKQTKENPYMPEKWDKEVDVIIIGYGGAGAVAAITAHDSGAEVLVLEKSPSLSSLGIIPDDRLTTQISGGGGNSHIALGVASSPSNEKDAADYLYSACSGQTPMDVCIAWAEEMCKNEAWFKKMGVKGSMNKKAITEYPSLPGSSSMSIFHIVRHGAALFATLDGHIQDREIEILFDTPGKDLIKDFQTGEIVGVTGENHGKTITIKARKGVVLCTGGFEFNEEMKNRFLNCWPMKFYGWGYNTGDGVRMAQKVGADLWHMDVVAGGSCSWFDDPQYDFGMTARTKTDNYLWVNKFGKRFCNEPEARNAHCGWVVHLERNTKYSGFSRVPSYIIFDHTSISAGPIGADEARKGGMRMGRIMLPPELGGYEGWSNDNRVEIDRGWIKTGDTIETLVTHIGKEMNAVTLKTTIETYNSYCEAGHDPEFGRVPEKMQPIDNPPYYAVPLYPGLVCTLGGPVRSSRAEVLDTDGVPIPRLYSAGSCGSIYGNTYSVTGGNLGELAAFGRIAGKNVAALPSWK